MRLESQLVRATVDLELQAPRLLVQSLFTPLQLLWTALFMYLGALYGMEPVLVCFLHHLIAGWAF